MGKRTHWNNFKQQRNRGQIRLDVVWVQAKAHFKALIH